MAGMPISSLLWPGMTLFPGCSCRLPKRSQVRPLRFCKIRDKVQKRIRVKCPCPKSLLKAAGTGPADFPCYLYCSSHRHFFRKKQKTVPHFYATTMSDSVTFFLSLRCEGNAEGRGHARAPGVFEVCVKAHWQPKERTIIWEAPQNLHPTAALV